MPLAQQQKQALQERRRTNPKRSRRNLQTQSAPPLLRPPQLRSTAALYSLPMQPLRLASQVGMTAHTVVVQKGT